MTYFVLVTLSLWQGLGDPSFDRRERYQRKLENLGWRGMPAGVLGGLHPDPEVRQRCRRAWGWLPDGACRLACRAVEELSRVPAEPDYESEVMP